MSTITITLRDEPTLSRCLIHIGCDDAEFITLDKKSFMDLTPAQQPLQAFNKSLDDLVKYIGVEKDIFIQADAGCPTILNYTSH